MMYDENILEAYKNCATAVVLTAAKDYKKFIRRYLRTNDETHLEDAADVQGFFHSDWFSDLTGLDPDAILDHLLREAVDEETERNGEVPRIPR